MGDGRGGLEPSLCVLGSCSFQSAWTPPCQVSVVSVPTCTARCMHVHPPTGMHTDAQHSHAYATRTICTCMHTPHMHTCTDDTCVHIPHTVTHTHAHTSCAVARGGVRGVHAQIWEQSRCPSSSHGEAEACGDRALPSVVTTERIHPRVF